MKAKPPLRRILAAFSLAAGVGWLAAGIVRSASVPTVTQGEPAAKAPDRKAATAGKRRTPDQVRAWMAAIRDAPTLEDRQRGTIQLAKSLPVDQLKLWYDRHWFDVPGGMEETIFETITRERWLAEDPGGLLKYCLERNRDGLHNETREVAGAWARRDPDAAFAFLMEKKGEDDFSYLIAGMGRALAKEDPARVLAEFGKLYRDPGFNKGFGGLDDVFEALAEAAPDAFARELATWHEPVRGRALARSTRVALKKDFAGAIANLTGMEGGKKLVLDAIRYDKDLENQVAAARASFPPEWFAEIASSLAYRVVADNPRQWLSEDLAAAGFSAAQAKEMRDAAIEKLAREPGSLAPLLGSIAWNEHERSLAVAKSLQAFKKPEDAAAWAAGLSDPLDIEAAEKALGWQLKQTAEAERDKSPATWIDKWSENASAFDYQATEPVKGWNGEDKNAALRAFKDLPAERKQALATKLMQRGDSTFPEALLAEGLNVLLENPPAENSREDTELQNAACRLAARWAAGDPGAGGKWVRSLPEGKTRTWAAKNLAAAWAAQEPQAARRWVGSLPASERTAVEAFLQEQR